MRKGFKIILVILLVIALILVGAWFLSRKKAKDAGQPVPTFRQFLGLGEKATQGTTTPDGGLSSDFTPDTPPDTPNGGTSGPSVSQFTNEPLTPSQPGTTSGQSGGTSTPGGFSGGGTITRQALVEALSPYQFLQQPLLQPLVAAIRT